MNRTAILALVLAAWAVFSSACAAETRSPAIIASTEASVDPRVTHAAKILFLAAQNGTVTRSELAPRVRSLLTPKLVRDTARELKKSGAPTAFAFEGSRDLTMAPGKGYLYRVSFARAPDLSWYVGFTPSLQVLGMFFFPYEQRMHLSESEVIAQLRAKLQRDAAAGRFSGAVLLAKDGAPVFSQAYGLADRSKKIRNTLDTKFRVGSMNKMFTAVSILQLVQAGKVRLEETVGELIPAYPNREIASRVTVEQLLTHTGGTGDFFGPLFDANRKNLRTLDDYIKLYGKRGPRFPPGSRFEYSNYGFILLGKIVENASGEDYYDYVNKHIYEPANMNSTGSLPENESVPDRSVGYTSEHGKLVSNADTLPYRGISAGGGYSTVGDLLRFADALQSNRLLEEKYTSMLTTGRVLMPALPDVQRKYAFGFADQTQNGIRCFGHDGGAPGMSGMLQICPANGYVIAVLANIDPPVADFVADFIVNRLPK